MVSSLLLVAVLSGCPTDSVTEASIQNAKQTISAQAQTGTLLFSKGDCLAVKIFSRSSCTHVAALVVEKKRVMVYDSMNGVGVRKLTLEKYLRNQCPNDLIVCHPKKRFSKREVFIFKKHLEEGIGRPYSFKQFVTGKSVKGIHCSEYLTGALLKCEIVSVKHPANVSPGSLLRGITRYDIYHQSGTVELDEGPIIAEQGSNRCQQLWYNTKACTQRCNRKIGHWFAYR